MGYTHRWCIREGEIAKDTFQRITADFRKMQYPLELFGIVFAGPDGTGPPIITEDELSFNGAVECGHFETSGDLTISWPTEHASGIRVGTDAEKIAGEWFAGHLLSSRRCDGDCSYESFVLEREVKRQKWESMYEGASFMFCKTAFRPYDFAVQVALVIAQHHLGHVNMHVSSDGPGHWQDAQDMCEHYLGYGGDFIQESPLTSVPKEPAGQETQKIITPQIVGVNA